MADVDASDDPGARVRYLDLATGLLERLIREWIDAMGLRPGDRVLDVGCGTGDAALLMAELVGETGKVVGLDSSATMIVAARARVPPGSSHVEFVEHDLYEMPFSDGSFDATRCSRVLQHIDDPLRAIREMARVTRPGGTITVSEPDFGGEMVDTDHRDIYDRMQDVSERRRAALPGDGWRGRQLWGLCHQAGLVDLTIQGVAVAIVNLEVANQLGRIYDMAEWAESAGAITSDEATIWREEMRQRDAEGRFMASIPGFAVYGKVPERSTTI